MASAIDVTITKDEATIYLDGLTQKMSDVVGNMGWNITQKLAKHIKAEANNAFQFPRPYLSETIEPRKKDKFNYEVHAAEYWSKVEHGRPAEPTKLTGILWNWAIKAKMNPFALRWIIEHRGTHARPFVEPGFNKAMPDIDAYIERESGRLIQ